MEKRLRSVGTHSGPFHADEVVACALLVVYDLVDCDRIVRTRDADKLAECEFVCDVGGIYSPEEKLFDHHQADYNGSFSSAGMVWRYLRDQGVVDEETYAFLTHILILGVDAHDIGLSPQIDGLCTFSHIISNFLPPQYDAPLEDQEKGFYAALEFTLGHLRRVFNRYEFIKKGREKVKAAMEEGKEFLFLDVAVPWLENFFSLGGESHPALFLVMPAGEHWKLRALPPTLGERMDVRFPLPEEWAGLLDEELKKRSGIEGAIFCHKGRFTSVWETKEDAMKALEYVLKRRNNEHRDI